MRCGAKCFLVEIEKDNEQRRKYVTARTPAGARKVIRSAFGENVTILTVREEKRQ